MTCEEKLARIKEIHSEYTINSDVAAMDFHICAGDREREQQGLKEKALKDIGKVLSE
jgi:hypothetical protein